MTKENVSQNLSLWESFVKGGKKMYINTRKVIRDITSQYPYTSQVIQLSFIYFCAFIDLFHSVLNNVLALGYFPEVLRPIFPFVKSILVSLFDV